MKNTDPIYPYQNLFITARPGMGAPIIVANIVLKYLEIGKKCLVFESTDGLHLTYTERFKIITEKTSIESIRPWVIEKGDLVVMYNYFFEEEAIMRLVDEYNCDVIVYETSRHLRDQNKELIELAKALKSIGKIFIFVTQTKRKINPFIPFKTSSPSASRHRKAIPYFDATATVYIDAYYNGVVGETEEIRIYERGGKKYRSVPVKFDFQHQKVKRK